MRKIIYLTTFKQKSFEFNNKKNARDFFYGVDILKKIYDISTYDISEFRIAKNKIFKIISKISFVLFGVYGLFTYELLIFFKKIPKDSKIICANDGIGFCTLLMNKVLRKNFKIYILSMGFYSKYFFKKNNIPFIRHFFINSLFTRNTSILFLGFKELDFFNKIFPKKIAKAIFFKFRIDDTFWSKREKTRDQVEPYILFIGNDMMRDYELVYQISKKIRDLKINIISNRIQKKVYRNMENVIIKGFIKGKFSFSDQQLRKIIQEAVCVILPIKDTLQPSGQSVALQSIACKTPVLISLYKGLWDLKKFKDEYNYFLIDQDNDATEWVKKIENIQRNQNDFNFLKQNAYEIFIKSSPYEKYLRQWEEIL